MPAARKRCQAGRFHHRRNFLQLPQSIECAPGVCCLRARRYHRRILRGDLPMLNGLWLGFFVVAAVCALAQWLIGGNSGIFAAMVESIFAMAKLSVEVMVVLFGTLTLWLGFLNIAQKAGIVDWVGKGPGPLVCPLMAARP